MLFPFQPPLAFRYSVEGALGEHVGHRRIYTLGVLVFSLSTL
jgi:hypothetical protein